MGVLKTYKLNTESNTEGYREVLEISHAEDKVRCIFRNLNTHWQELEYTYTFVKLCGGIPIPHQMIN